MKAAGGGLIFDSYLDRPNKVRLWSNSKTGGQWVYPLDADRCPEANRWPEDTTTPDSGDVMQHQTGACVDHATNSRGRANHGENSATAMARTLKVSR